ncbi:MAG: sensor histidine kinase [Candidatus Dormibacteria bacterium]
MSVPSGGRDESPGALPINDFRAALIDAGVLLAAELSLPILLRRLVEIAVQITGAQYGALGVTGPGGRIVEFITVGLDEWERAAIGPIPSGRGILGALIHDPRPLRLVRLQDDPRSVGFPPHHPPMTSFLGAPVRAKGHVFGNLYLTEKVGGLPFDEADESAVETLAVQAGVAIANAETYRDLRQRERWLAALHEITTALLAGERQQVLMTTIIKSARELGGADVAAIAVPVGDGSTKLKVVAAFGFGAEQLLAAPARSSGTASHLVLSTGSSQTLRAGSPGLDASLMTSAGVPLSALMVVPMVIGGRAIGTISLTLSEPDAEFTPEALSLLESFAGQASLSLDYVRVQERSRRLAVVEERNRIARDLHDEPVQALIHLARRLEGMAAESSAARTPAAELNETRELAVAVGEGLRQLTEGLRSEILDVEGLPAALQDLARRFDARADIPVKFALKGPPTRWDPELEHNLFRVAQEALNNIERHARARHVQLELIVRQGGVTLRVIDDGVGFITSGAGAAAPGLGTLGMRERVALQRGLLQIRSWPGRGTVLRATVPTSPD